MLVRVEMLVRILLLLAPSPPATANASLDHTLAALVQKPAGSERTVAASETLLGTPYEKEPLGEGRPPHPNPRLRLDHMDCQTFVETAIAMGQAQNQAELRATLDDVRYGGPVDYDDRNHFMMSQWIPHNAAKGYLRDVTREIFPQALTATKVVTAKSWAQRSPKKIELPADHVPLGEYSLAYVPLERLAALEAQIPTGTLLLWVRAESTHYPDRITHLGFLVRHGKQTLLRHESDVYHRVIDEPLAHFVARNSRYDWKVLGASLWAVEDNSAHVRALGTSAHRAEVP